MQSLIDVLAPNLSGWRVWPIAAAVTVVAAAATAVRCGSSLETATNRRAATKPPIGSPRMEPGAAKRVSDRFGRSGRAYAASASQIASNELDRCEALAGDGHRRVPPSAVADAKTGQLVSRRRSC
jgi:hypothetical protein